jgi:peptidoglycan hydrolase-like protein with peptidoglycan-binding domain
MTAAARPVLFRAGRAPGLSVVPDEWVREATAAHAAGSRVLLADVSEFQPDIADGAYLSWSKAIIIRAAYGDAHDDRAWYGGQRRALLLEGGAQFLGIYQYIVAGQDVTAQARAFCRLVGKLSKGEYLVGDWEEGGGDQSGRRATWNHVVASETGFTPDSYSGRFYARDHGLAPVNWVASYGGSEPPEPHLLWQFTDRFTVPGVGLTDCSVHNGPLSGLTARAWGGVPARPPVRPPAFPYPAGDYLGVASKDPHCHSGFLTADRPHVQAWQGQMAHRGWALAPTGTFDHASEAVCRQFQREKGLAADGKVGPVTWGATWTAPVT